MPLIYGYFIPLRSYLGVAAVVLSLEPCLAKQRLLQPWMKRRGADRNRLRGQGVEREEDREVTVDHGVDRLLGDDLARLSGGHAADLAVAAGVDLEVLRQGYVIVVVVVYISNEDMRVSL